MQPGTGLAQGCSLPHSKLDHTTLIRAVWTVTITIMAATPAITKR